MGKILVVGGAGYIGSVLVRRLLDDGYEVRVLDQLLFGDHSIRPLTGRERFQFIEGDFRDGRLVAEAARGVNALIHLGAIVGDPACQIDEGFVCPRCGIQSSWGKRNLLLCADCGYQASVTAGTIFQDTRKPLTLWFRAAWWVTTQKGGASARVAAGLGFG